MRGRAVPVEIDGVSYASQSAAARALGVPQADIYWRHVTSIPGGLRLVRIEIEDQIRAEWRAEAQRLGITMQALVHRAWEIARTAMREVHPWRTRKHAITPPVVPGGATRPLTRAGSRGNARRREARVAALLSDLAREGQR